MPIDTSALPPGWSITKTLDFVPDPNAATLPAAAGPGFMRWTYICTNHLGAFVVSDGSEDACYQQALSLAATTGAANLP